jgi:hypothetical protein
MALRLEPLLTSKVELISSYDNKIRNEDMKQKQKAVIDQNSVKINQNIRNILSHGSSRDKIQLKSFMHKKDLDDRDMKVFSSTVIHRSIFK